MKIIKPRSCVSPRRDLSASRRDAEANVLSSKSRKSLNKPLTSSHVHTQEPDATQKLLYVAVPGIRDYLQYGGHGLLVFDIENGHKFVRRIPSAGLKDKGKPINVKGICVSVSLQRLFVSTIASLMRRIGSRIVAGVCSSWHR